MINKRLGFDSFLKNSEIEKLEETAMEILEKGGMKISNKKAIDKLLMFEGVSFKNGRVYLGKNLVRKKIEDYKQDKKNKNMWFSNRNVNVKSAGDKEDDELYLYKPALLPSGHCRYILDHDNGKIRPLVTEDVIEMTKLLDNLSKSSTVVTSAPGNPTELPALLQPVARYKLSCEYSRYGGFTSPCENLRPSEYVYEMSKVVGKPFSLVMSVISPLKMEGNEFDIMVSFLDKKVPMLVTTWGMFGATTPLSIAKASAQIIAESIGAYTIVKLLSDDGVVNFFMRLIGFDMKEATYNYGTPESILLDALTVDLNKFYGNSPHVQMNTMAKEPGTQSGVEKFSTAFFGILTKCRSLGDVGSLCLDEVFSPEQLIYDCEILDNAMRLAKGFKFEEFNTDSFIKELLEKKTFLDSEETTAEFRDFYWISKIFSRSMLQQHFARSENQRELVKQLIRENIKNHDFILDEDKRKEINRIYEAAKKELG